MISFDDTICKRIFNHIFIEKNLNAKLFSNEFKYHELDNTITKQTSANPYCDEFNQFFNTIVKIDVKHFCKNANEFSVIGIVEFKDNTKKDLASFVKINSDGKIEILKFFLVLHTDADIYGRKTC